ncbi:MAG: PTS sugar transporter subunit IIC [Culicoidibacterales bacterium]
MQKFMDLLEAKILPIASRLTTVKWLNALKDTMIAIMPFLIIGSLFLLVAYFPIPNWSQIVGNIFGPNWEATLTTVTDATFGMMGFFMLIGVPYNYAKALNANPMISMLLAVAAFIVLMPISEGMIPVTWMSSKGMLVNIIISITVTLLYIKIDALKIAPKMPDTVPTGVTKSFQALVPIFLILTLMLILRILIQFTAYPTVHDLLFTIIQVPLLKLGATLPATIFAESVGQFLWFFGIHGNAIISGVMDPIWLSLSAENLTNFQNGLEPVNIITKQFKEIYMQLGGSGSTLPLVVLLIFSKSKQLKTLGLLALPASLFNINEPIIFGLPIVLNSMLFIPWMITTPVIATVTYFAMSWGLVGITTGITIPWTTPVIASGFLVSGISGSVLQLVLLCVGFLIYLPFFKMIEKQKITEETGLQPLDFD